MMNIFLFLGIAFLLTLVLGRVLEKIRVPWIFGALILGTLLAFANPFAEIISSATFNFLAQLGMYFLLFLIGLEIDLKEMKAMEKFLLRSTFFIIFLEGVAGSLLVYVVFGYSWLISFLVALSFATVGEAILIPILDEFRVVNTALGQAIIGIGTLDDIVEIVLLILVSLLIHSQIGASVIVILLVFASLLLLTWGFRKFSLKEASASRLGGAANFLIAGIIFLVFIGIGSVAGAAAFAAILAGVAVKGFIPSKYFDEIEPQIKAVTYGFFAPIFFLWVGTELDVQYLLKYPLLILLVVGVSNGAKLLGSYLVGRKRLGSKKSLLLGIGLSVRFSTSIIIIKILFENSIIGAELYSVIIASSIVFTFILPVLFSNLLVKWQLLKRE